MKIENRWKKEEKKDRANRFTYLACVEFLPRSRFLRSAGKREKIFHGKWQEISIANDTEQKERRRKRKNYSLGSF